MKTCTKCKKDKSEDDFYKRPNGKFQSSWCKKCTIILMASPKYTEYKKKWKKDAGWRYEKEYIKKHPEKVRARSLAYRARRAGKLKRESCEKCSVKPRIVNGTCNVQGHHPDYKKPLIIQWLCFKCHKEIHRVNPN